MILTKSQTLILKGFVNPSDTYPSFLVPIFYCEDRLYIQSNTKNDLVLAFTEVEIENDILMPLDGFRFSAIVGDEFSVSVRTSFQTTLGQDQVLAFGFSPSDIVVGTRTALVRALRSDINKFNGYPFVFLEVCSFIKDPILTEYALDIARTQLINEGHLSPERAEQWVRQNRPNFGLDQSFPALKPPGEEQAKEEIQTGLMTKIIGRNVWYDGREEQATEQVQTGRGGTRSHRKHPAKPVRLFLASSHKDEGLRKQLEAHLSVLKRQGVIEEWHEREIEAGNEWRGKIDEHLDDAQVVLLLISPDFLASDYCFDIEMKRALERHDKGEARVIPIILRPVDWRGAPFGSLQALPRGAKPVVEWRHEAGFKNVAGGIQRVVEEMTRNLIRRPGAVIDATSESPSPKPTEAHPPASSPIRRPSESPSPKPTQAHPPASSAIVRTPGRRGIGSPLWMDFFVMSLFLVTSLVVSVWASKSVTSLVASVWASRRSASDAVPYVSLVITTGTIGLLLLFGLLLLLLFHVVKRIGSPELSSSFTPLLLKVLWVLLVLCVIFIGVIVFIAVNYPGLTHHFFRAYAPLFPAFLRVYPWN